MDITVERILSLLPKKPNGEYVHGAKKDFCLNIGAPTNIISEWENGKTKSYRNYIYQIATKYNVSPEWLKGETDEKTPPAPAMSAVKQEVYKLIESMNDEQARKLVQLTKIIMGEK